MKMGSAHRLETSRGPWLLGRPRQLLRERLQVRFWYRCVDCGWRSRPVRWRWALMFRAPAAMRHVRDCKGKAA